MQALLMLSKCSRKKCSEAKKFDFSTGIEKKERIIRLGFQSWNEQITPGQCIEENTLK